MPSESELEIELLSITTSKKFSFSSGGNRHDFIFPPAEGVYKNCISDTRRLRNFCPAKLGDLLFLICAIFSKGEDMKEYAELFSKVIDVPFSGVNFPNRFLYAPGSALTPREAGRYPEGGVFVTLNDYSAHHANEILSIFDLSRAHEMDGIFMIKNPDVLFVPTDNFLGGGKENRLLNFLLGREGIKPLEFMLNRGYQISVKQPDIRSFEDRLLHRYGGVSVDWERGEILVDFDVPIKSFDGSKSEDRILTMIPHYSEQLK